MLVSVLHEGPKGEHHREHQSPPILSQHRSKLCEEGERLVAPIERVIRPSDGHQIIREAFSEWVQNESTGEHAKLGGVYLIERDENGGIVSFDMRVTNCSVTGGAPPDNKTWNGIG